MKVLIIGATGFLGSKAAELLLDQGHEVCGIALPELPEGTEFPKELHLILGDFTKMTDEEINTCMEGCQGIIYAAGIDERIDGKSPIIDLYRKYNVDAVRRLFSLARQAGVCHAVICGSYYAYFDRIWPKMKLSSHHPYILSRKEQEETALSLAGENFHVAILEFPVIFGAMKGRRSTWFYVIDSLSNMKKDTTYPGGGTAVITVRQAAEAIVGAVQKNRGGNIYPIGFYNLEWKDIIKVMNRYLGYTEKKVVTISKLVYRAGGKRLSRVQKRNHIESGLDMRAFTELQYAEKYIDPELGADFLGITGDDYEAAIGQTVEHTLRILRHEEKGIPMQYE